MSAQLASAVVRACAQAGVREFCVCAGARNVSLVVALARSTGCRTWHFYDERAAGFFALGRMMASAGGDRPVAVVTTSGTAVAELLPATVEAYYQRLPLVLVTADRPAEFRGSGAPQAIEQVGIFSHYAPTFDVCGEGVPSAGRLVRFLTELSNADRGGRVGPRHLNACFGEPTAEMMATSGGVEFPAAVPERAPSPARRELADEVAAFVTPPDGLLVMLGNLRADQRAGVAGCLQRVGAPVIAEAGSGLRERLGHLAVASAPADLRRVLRIGGVPSSRLWRDLELLPAVEVLSVEAGGFAGLARGCRVLEGRVDWGAVEVATFDAGADAGAGGGGRAGLSLVPGSELWWLRVLSEAIPRGARVFLGNSLPLREWNAAATFEDRGLECFSCRGANGIDGALSTFAGLAADGGEFWAVVGDLTALYDLGAPWALSALPPGRRRIVVINNGGGKIFARLPAFSELSPRERRAVENDHALRFEHWAAMWGLGYLRVTGEDELPRALADDALVIEIVVVEEEGRR